MAHLGRFRKGWENENLATFLLSRIAFVAHPLTVADDVGADFSCTLFEATGSDELLPRNSFAIQIKSSKDRIEATSKIEYFERLELPYFVGVIDQPSLKLSIYSGEYLPILFAHYGKPNSLKLSLEDRQITFEEYCSKKSNDHILHMPHVINLDAHDGPETIVKKASQLLELCSRIHQNISSNVSQEYVFKLGDGRPLIMAGPSSASTFRDNFHYRLAEVFKNLAWLHENRPEQFNPAECQLFESFYLELRKAGQIPTVLAAAYQALKQQLTMKAGQD
jgi:hypothetical protein